jgi:diaminopropionate ammonia-lyase
MPKAFVPSHRATHANLFTASDLELQRDFFRRRPQLAATPLHRCAALAAELGIAELLVKDETARFGLNAFKATGAQFAVATAIERGEIRAGDVLACASEGNHGRAVARAARESGCPARVYMSRRVTNARVRAIESEGATVVLVDGSYDDAVRLMAREAAEHGWTIVSDTSWPGYVEIPWLIMLGYTRIFDEIAQQADGAIDTMFVPAGVGGLLAAASCWADLSFPANPPRIVAVEPLSAACVLESARAGQPVAVSGPHTTTMGGLRCGEMSPVVLPAVQALVDAFVAIEDDYAFEAMRRLARPTGSDPAIECGPSGAAALGGLLATAAHPAMTTVRDRIELGSRCRIVVLATEGMTEPELFDEVLARP